MAVASVHAAPAVDHDVGAEFADHADYVFEDGVAPDFFGFFGSFGEAEIPGAGEIEFDAVAASGGEQRDVGVEAAGEVGEDGAAFVIGMRGDVEDARGDAGGVDGFDGFGQAGAGTGSGRELRVRRYREKRGNDEEECR